MKTCMYSCIYHSRNFLGDISFILILNNSVGNVINFTHIKRFSVDKRVESSIRYYILSIE